MAPKALKRPAAAPMKKPSAAAKRPAPQSDAPAGGAKRSQPAKAAAAEPATPARPAVAAEELKSLKAYIVNLERRPDRWSRVEAMLREEVPWLPIEQFYASDGTKNPVPEEEVALTWNTSRNAHYADYFEWVFDAPGTESDGTVWKWAADVSDEDEVWDCAEDGDDPFQYIVHSPQYNVGEGSGPKRTATITKKATGEACRVRLQLSPKSVDPGETQKMSGGERGCAHSHYRLWKVAAERQEPTLVLEDDVHITFERNGDLGKSNGRVFTERLAQAMRYASSDFDVIYLGWSGWRGGHLKVLKEDKEENPDVKRFLRKAEYVWTTVAYVISQGGARKLLEAAQPLSQPVDNFMAWEASQGRLNSYVVMDEMDEDGTWAGGIVDQFDFQGDSDIQKSDGGVQGDDMKEFAVDA